MTFCPNFTKKYANYVKKSVGKVHNSLAIAGILDEQEDRDDHEEHGEQNLRGYGN